MTNLSADDSVSQPQTKCDLPWFRFFAKDWIADTAYLSLPARGALISMLAHEWASGGWGNMEESMIIRVLGCTSEEWRAVMGELWPLFSKMVRELFEWRTQKQAEVAERVNAGRKGGLARAARQARAQASATVLPDQNSSDSDSDSDTDTEENQDQTQNTCLIPAKPSLEQCEHLYDRYPRKVGRRGALLAIEKALIRLMKGEGGRVLNLEQALAFTEAQVSTFSDARANQDPAFTPHPATWFNRSSYLDDSKEWISHEGQRQQHERQSSESTTQARNRRTREAILEGFGLTETGGGDPRSDGGDFEGGTLATGSRILGGIVESVSGRTN
jgi:uncharacterized protein YdaU (DUF1376 family)